MINVIDLQFLGKPHTIASYLIESSEGPILIETGPHSTFPTLVANLSERGYRVADVQHVFITHIHLDHAGAAWAFAEQGATIYLHPFGYKHMKDPSKLIDSASRIYGDQMDRLWGQLKPIDEYRLQVVDHGEIITIGDCEVKAWHTPGHAVHHIAWQIGQELIAGDVAGVRIEDGPVVPPCPPPDINIEKWQASIELVKGLALENIYLSHYGAVRKENIDKHLDELSGIMLDWANWMKPHFEAGAKAAAITPAFQAYVKQQLMSSGLSESQIELYENANPSWMSVAGLMRYWKKKNT